MKKILAVLAVAAALTLTGCSSPGTGVSPKQLKAAEEQISEHEREIADLEARLAAAEQQVEECTGQSNAYREAAMAVSDATVSFLDDIAANVYTPEMIAPVDLSVAESYLAEAKSYLCDGSY